MSILKPSAPTRGEQFDTNRKAMLEALHQKSGLPIINGDHSSRAISTKK